MKKTVYVDGMTCNHCKMHVEKALSQVPGVSRAAVDLDRKLAEVEVSVDVADDALLAAVNDAGYDALKVEG